VSTSASLHSFPLKAGVVVLDAARQQPFIEGRPDSFASGLALVSRSAMLIASTAAPGRSLPMSRGNMARTRRSLAEMMRTGGLP